MSDKISDDAISKLSELVRSRTGLHFPMEKRVDLKRGIKAAARELDFEDAQSCADWLATPPLTGERLEALVPHLTVGETFFFRDKSVFQLLKDHILSGRIRAHYGGQKSIRFWSAGCCTGEEAYSIAIVMDQMMPLLKDWKIKILGTDINTRFLKKAENGVYTRWSFRETPDKIVKEYFKKIDDRHFEIHPRIKRMVSFSKLNLAEQVYPLSLNNTEGMDVIFCRNVLMYFAPEVREQVLRFFSQSLSEGGWLIVSPSETTFVQKPGLNAVRLPGATLHRKGPRRKEGLEKIKPVSSSSHPVQPVIASPPPPAKQGVTSRGRGTEQKKHERILARRKIDIYLGESSPKKRDKTKQEIYQEALSLYEKGRYEESVQELSKVLSNDQRGDNGFLLTPESMALMAKALANLGKLDQAKTWCEQAIHAEKLQPAHYYLLATIYQEQGDLGECMKSLKKTLYLDPEFVLAHFALGSFTKKGDKRNESRKHLENARSLLLSMDSEDVLPHSDGMTAGRLREVIGLMIGD